MKTKNPIRFGFTQIELIVVLAIIILLFGLLLPSIQLVRRQSFKVRNQNNIKQILIAVNSYVAANKGALPTDSWSSANPYPMPLLLPYTEFANTTQGRLPMFVAEGDPSLESIQMLAAQSNASEYQSTLNSVGYRAYIAAFQQAWKNWEDTVHKPVYDAAYNSWLASNPGDTGGANRAGTIAVNQLNDSNQEMNAAVTAGTAAEPAAIQAYEAANPPQDFFDPTLEQPLSYPFMKLSVPIQGPIDNLEPSNIAYITEAYAGCAIPYSSWNVGPSTTSRFVGLNTDPTVQYTYRVWKGFTPCGGCSQAPICSTPCIIPSNCSAQDPRMECHSGEYYSYATTGLIATKNYFDDYPLLSDCNPSLPQSMVKGSLNIGYLDGSVRSLSSGVDRNIVIAIMNASAPTQE